MLLKKMCREPLKKKCVGSLKESDLIFVRVVVLMILVSASFLLLFFVSVGYLHFMKGKLSQKSVENKMNISSFNDLQLPNAVE